MALLLAVALASPLAAIACRQVEARPLHDAAPLAASPPAAPANPFATVTPERQTIAGRIEERIAAGSYVYLAVRDRDDALRWAVVMGSAPDAGADVVLTSMGKHARFHSPRLGREFDELHFAVLSPAPAS